MNDKILNEVIELRKNTPGFNKFNDHLRNISQMLRLEDTNEYKEFMSKSTDLNVIFNLVYLIKYYILLTTGDCEMVINIGIVLNKLRNLIHKKEIENS